ncbi:hypothetical protein COT77_02285 [Candidatus Berkelbacteria bacterium CG10_big_fil_rev_8_21_14_0_10_41_12]|uniref:Uncharacterized protein n=1 Tax=Candidatus Berkelbacteria bacterium CG10_big_fil_rev_8_21_14_0_10_41_12 TaxID=1974513 RepID=A0A2M6WWY5_9BACT|nr:MAG: hypothetical protein COT77_02285 [Candidatus Berkelbacteria bacterium CG10_big_fil_rev_8_21_14_0_10_41_12]
MARITGRRRRANTGRGYVPPRERFARSRPRGASVVVWIAIALGLGFLGLLGYLAYGYFAAFP